MKIAIIGAAGSLGSTTAFVIGQQRLAEEVKLIDLKKNVVESHVMDLYQGLLEDTHVKFTAADYSDIGDCGIIIITASVPYDSKVSDRSLDVKNNMKIVNSICESMRPYICKDAIIITGTNPIEIFAYAYQKLLGLKRNHAIGFCAPDQIRMKWAIEEITGADYADIDAYCAGEHGKAVRLYDQATVKGRPLVLTDAQKAKVEEMNVEWFAHWNSLDCGRTTGWTSAVHITKLVDAIVHDRKTLLPAAAVMDGEFGIHDVAMDMVCRLGADGIEEIVDMKFTQEQLDELKVTEERMIGLEKSVELI